MGNGFLVSVVAAVAGYLIIEKIKTYRANADATLENAVSDIAATESNSETMV